jgi:hypothetical protein
LTFASASLTARPASARARAVSSLLCDPLLRVPAQALGLLGQFLVGCGHAAGHRGVSLDLLEAPVGRLHDRGLLPQLLRAIQVLFEGEDLGQKA